MGDLIVRYVVCAVIVGLAAAWALSAFERYQERRAILQSLPAGYQFSGCKEVRAMGLAPLYKYERGYSTRMDGDGDGIACEPYRGM